MLFAFAAAAHVAVAAAALCTVPALLAHACEPDTPLQRAAVASTAAPAIVDGAQPHSAPAVDATALVLAISDTEAAVGHVVAFELRSAHAAAVLAASLAPHLLGARPEQ